MPVTVDECCAVRLGYRDHDPVDLHYRPQFFDELFKHIANIVRTQQEPANFQQALVSEVFPSERPVGVDPANGRSNKNRDPFEQHSIVVAERMGLERLDADHTDDLTL